MWSWGNLANTCSAECSRKTTTPRRMPRVTRGDARGRASKNGRVRMTPEGVVTASEPPRHALHAPPAPATRHNSSRQSVPTGGERRGLPSRKLPKKTHAPRHHTPRRHRVPATTRGDTLRVYATLMCSTLAPRPPPSALLPPTHTACPCAVPAKKHSLYRGTLPEEINEERCVGETTEPGTYTEP